MNKWFMLAKPYAYLYALTENLFYSSKNKSKELNLEMIGAEQS